MTGATNLMSRMSMMCVLILLSTDNYQCFFFFDITNIGGGGRMARVESLICSLAGTLGQH